MNLRTVSSRWRRGGVRRGTTADQRFVEPATQPLGPCEGRERRSGRSTVAGCDERAVGGGFGRCSYPREAAAGDEGEAEEGEQFISAHRNWSCAARGPRRRRSVAGANRAKKTYRRALRFHPRRKAMRRPRSSASSTSRRAWRRCSEDEAQHPARRTTSSTRRRLLLEERLGIVDLGCARTASWRRNLRIDRGPAAPPREARHRGERARRRGAWAAALQGTKKRSTPSRRIRRTWRRTWSRPRAGGDQFFGLEDTIGHKRVIYEPASGVRPAALRSDEQSLEESLNRGRLQDRPRRPSDDPPDLRPRAVDVADMGASPGTTTGSRTAWWRAR